MDAEIIKQHGILGLLLVNLLFFLSKEVWTFWKKKSGRYVSYTELNKKLDAINNTVGNKFDSVNIQLTLVHNELEEHKKEDQLMKSEMEKFFGVQGQINKNYEGQLLRIEQNISNIYTLISDIKNILIERLSK